MIRMTLAQAADILGVKCPFAAIEFNGISIDTRTTQPGNLFVALKGSRVDGHDYIAEASQKGAAAALVTHHVESALPQLQVEDTTDALGKLGTAWRNQFTIPFIAVTGSNGKTTLKNMVASILTAACDGDSTQVLATQGTLNNHLGLPLTLIRLNKNHRYAVIEMGMNHFGEIEYLTKMTRPSVAVITNAAAAHLEGVGSIEGVARAKAEIFLGLPPNGTAILNRDDAFFTLWHEQIGQRPYLTFGFHPDADVSATLIESDQQLTLRTPKGQIDIQLPLLGRHNVVNALAATAAALAIGIDLVAVKKGLETIQPAPGRLQLHTLSNGVKIIDDTYNANPFSLQAAVETLSSFTGKKILVLGDMKELGIEAKSLHHTAGEKIRAAGIDYLFTYGELSANTAHGFGEGAYHFSEQEKLVNALKPFLYNQTTILVKGSRSMQMEKVVAELVQ
ncbi:UDP-N-acetylmuramoyl-tripeptide--D-alanyl-D-alanine ligase [Aquicella lusitana]|uniref:UDP-N-acetylmuramoyl-tripeptide--D-alanyl-D-alanine ligase n=1 Tax=Aquicella lusitana TaxID=254246 RepID=A0A370GRQ5_9COXI|nr:UDP-N-acetylmuramoyl-tripeptide--D-alanyl-D-alanine ligase [Aquicella lusitana]RDI45164.1 UDP-N-acetylmuramoyl-tripeptide--D-alanyl-D-alanine ligase [Aquicella lusitana]VVC72766.1 UDP-N-acetylmuramoyl-tripeptide--D-alanyl-D-alanine ligase [Aquicella lusitana]